MTSKKEPRLKFDFTLIVVCFIALLANSAYSLIAPFLPIELQNYGVPLELNGYVFSSYSVAVILCSPLTVIFLKRIKRKTLIQIGVFSMGSSMIMFGLISYIDRTYLFYSLALIARFIQGFSSS